MNDSLKNIFTVSDLRKRVLFTLGLLAVYRVGHHITDARREHSAALDELARQLQNTMFGLCDMFSGGSLSTHDDLRARHHAVHQRVDHPAAADGGLARISSSCRRKASSAAARSRSTRATARSCSAWCRRSASPSSSSARRTSAGGHAAGLSPGHGVPADDGADADDRHAAS